MIPVYLGAVVLVAAATAVGSGIFAITGWRAGRGLTGATGLALLMAVTATLVRVSHGPLLAAVVSLVLALAALAWPPSRRLAIEELGSGALLALVALAIASIPFFVAGHAGILGVGRDNDMAAHLTTAWWLENRTGPAPVGALGEPLLSGGYPLGPHGIAAALSRGLGLSMIHAFNALTLAIPALTALAALAALPERPRLGRWAVALAVGLCYMAVSSLVEGAFKEPIEALLLLAFVLGLRELAAPAARPRARQGLALGVLAAGTVYVFSVQGLAWPVAAVGLFVLVEGARRLPRWRSSLRAAVPVAALGVVALVVVSAPDAHRIIRFATSQYAEELGPGNLFHAVPVPQALGMWLAGDFRFTPHPLAPTGALMALAVLAFAGAMVWWLRRRDLAPVTGIAAALIIYAVTATSRGLYQQAKALTIMAPLVALVVGAALLAAWAGRERATARPAWTVARGAVRVLGVILLLGAGASTFLALRDAPVRPQVESAGLERLRPLLGHERTLILPINDFARWDLRGVNLYTGPQLYTTGTRTVRIRQRKLAPGVATLDFDSVGPRTLDKMTFVITTDSPFQSAAPANFHVAARAGQYVLWHRVGPTVPRLPAERDWRPGGHIRCDAPSVRRLGAAGGRAAVLPKPVVGAPDHWHGHANRAGTSASQTVELPAGTWDLSLEYISATGLRLSAAGLRAQMPATLGRLGPFWTAGTVHQARSGPLTIRVTAERTSWFGRLIGAPATTRSFRPPDFPTLYRVAFTRRGQQATMVPLRRACGDYADWYSGPGL